MDPYEAYIRHVNPGLGNFLRLSGRDLRLVRARGGVIEDAAGNLYDDWVTGCGSFNLGHNPEVVKEAIREFLALDAPTFFEENLNPYAGELAARLAEAAGPRFETCFFTNSGTEAVEAAIKTAIAATGRKKIAHADGAFHGTTLGSLACMGRGIFRDDFEAVLARFPEVPFGDAASLEKTLAGEDVAAFLVEPIQVESGVRIASGDYLREARALCDAHGALLVFDEVQTGMGRTGRLFAYQHDGVEPDIVAVAKSLGGGMVPIGAAVMAKGVWSKAFGSYSRSQIHTCTFGGNALCSRVALKALERLGDEAFLSAVRERGERLFDRISKVLEGSPVVRRISWRGLLGGIQFEDVDHPWLRWENMGMEELAGHPTSGALVMERLGRKGILALVCAHDWTVLRIEPPLDVPEDACARFAGALGESVRWLEENAEPKGERGP